MLRDGYDVAAEWVRWEHAVALLGPLLGVNPFGQPNVQAAKDATNAALAGELTLIAPQVETPEGAAITFAGTLPGPGHAECDLAAALGHALAALRPHDYLAVLAYLPGRQRPARAPDVGRAEDLGGALAGGHARTRPALPALDRAAAQGRPEHRRLRAW